MNGCARGGCRGAGEACGPDGWREDGSPEHVVVQAPDHPLACGVEPFTIPQSAAFAEPFAVPPPEAVVLMSRWNSGETIKQIWDSVPSVGGEAPSEDNVRKTVRRIWERMREISTEDVRMPGP